MNINPSPNIDMPHYEDGEMGNVKTNYFTEVENWKNPYLLNLNEISNQETLFQKMEYIWVQKYRRKQSTIHNYINDLKRMTNDDITPVDLLHPNPAQIIAYLDIHEDKKHPYKTIDPWKAINALYKMCGIDTKLWGYIPPSVPRAKVRIIPLPTQVKKLINHKYTTDKKTNEAITKLLNIGFLLGIRPQEYPIIKIEDIYIEEGYLIITEPKKHMQRRQIFPEKDLMKNDRRKSIKNQIKLKNKINQKSPYLFIQPNNGRPWTTNYLRKWLTGYVKPVMPDFSMYTMRHWCAIARLIQTKVETGKFDVYHVKEWLGQDDIKSTMHYVRFAEKYYRLAPYDWVRALLKFHKEQYKSTTQTENYIKQPLFRVEFTGVAGYSPERGLTKVLLLTSLKKTDFPCFATSLIKTFLFSLQHGESQFKKNGCKTVFKNTVYDIASLFSYIPSPIYSETPIPVTEDGQNKILFCFPILSPPSDITHPLNNLYDGMQVQTDFIISFLSSPIDKSHPASHLHIQQHQGVAM